MKIRFILGWIIDNTTSVINFQWNAQNSDFGHVRTYSSLHRLRNTKGKIHGTYLGNIYIYGIYRECIKNIHRYLWCKVIRNTDPMGRPPKAVPVFLIILYHKYLWIFLIHSLYIYIYIFHIYFLDMFHVFSLVCFLIYGVTSRSGHDRSQSFVHSTESWWRRW